MESAWKEDDNSRTRLFECPETAGETRCRKIPSPGNSLQGLVAVARKTFSRSVDPQGRKEESESSSTFAAEDLLRD